MQQDKQARSAPVQDIGVEQDERVFARIEARKNRDAAAVKEHSLNDVRCQCCGYMTYHREHMGCIRAAAAAPVQEPVAWMVDVDLANYQGQSEYRTILAWNAKPVWSGTHEVNEVLKAVPLYATPPAAQRQWVGLSEEEIDKLKHLIDWTATWSHGRFAYEIEQLLKIKNT